MKILLVNNFYYNRGGDCTYLLSLKKILEKKGHKVIIFSMHHPENYDSEYSKYFVSYINYAEMSENKNFYSGLRVLTRSIYSLDARRKMRSLIEEQKPDIAHLNNIRQHITTSILPLLNKHGIPVVWTLHDYQLICPNISFLARGEICERCKKRKYYWPVFTRCKKDSFLASAMAAVEHTAQLIMKMYDTVDVFIAPSKFMRNKLIEYEFSKAKIKYLSNFIDIDYENKNIDENYYFFAGRLEREKGVKTLVDAAIKADAGRLKIVGDGTLKENLISYVQSKDKNENIKFLGRRSREEIIKLISGCKFAVLPSEWYENCPYAVLEAFACGKAVIGANTGGIPELIRDKETGLIFEPGNSDDLSAKIEFLDKNPDIVKKMGENARRYVTEELNAEKHYRKLIGIYKSVLAGKLA